MGVRLKGAAVKETYRERSEAEGGCSQKTKNHENMELKD